MNPVIDALQSVLLRDLDKLADELNQYPTEESIWNLSGSIKNPGGNLALHLCGNLQHYVGVILGKSNYVRNREAEFSSRNIPRAKLLAEITATKKALTDTLPTLTDNQLFATYPQEVLGKPMTTIFFLLHLSAHFSYHLGQVNYHRRLVAG